jgi:hypothetical protein
VHDKTCDPPIESGILSTFLQRRGSPIATRLSAAVGREPLVDQNALLAALDEGRVRVQHPDVVEGPRMPGNVTGIHA